MTHVLFYLLLQKKFFYYKITYIYGGVFMDKILNEDLILNQLEHLSLEDFDKLVNTITKEEFTYLKGL